MAKMNLVGELQSTCHSLVEPKLIALTSMEAMGCGGVLCVSRCVCSGWKGSDGYNDNDGIWKV